MSSNTKFFGSKQEMAVLKHVALSNYLTPFATMVTKSDTNTPVWYIDAYAGPGKYEPRDGKAGEPGSPLIALGAANTLSKLEPPRTLNCVFIEQDQAYVQSLQDICDTGRFAGTHAVIQGDSHDTFAEAALRAGTSPLLIFIDPFGTALPYEVLENLLKSRPKTAATEILFNFHLGSVARIGAVLSRHGSLRPGDKKTETRLDAFLGFDWRKHFLGVYQPGEKHSATRGAQAVAAAFRQNILDRTGYRSLPISVGKAHDVVPRFELALFFRHDAAEYKFADAAQAANTAWRKRVSEGEARKNAELHLDSLFAADFDDRQFEDLWRRREVELGRGWQGAIEANILDALRSAPSIRVASSVRPLYRELLGLAGEKHLRAAWKSLADRQLTNTHPAKIIYGTITRGPAWSLLS
jgi:three-Cys-motif partner protein